MRRQRIVRQRVASTEANTCRVCRNAAGHASAQEVATQPDTAGCEEAGNNGCSKDQQNDVHTRAFVLPHR